MKVFLLKTTMPLDYDAGIDTDDLDMISVDTMYEMTHILEESFAEYPNKIEGVASMIPDFSCLVCAIETTGYIQEIYFYDDAPEILSMRGREILDNYKNNDAEDTARDIFEYVMNIFMILKCKESELTKPEEWKPFAKAAIAAAIVKLREYTRD